MYGNIILDQEFNHITDEVVERYAKERDRKTLEDLKRIIYIYKSSDELKLIIQLPGESKDIEIDLTEEKVKEVLRKINLRVITIPF